MHTIKNITIIGTSHISIESVKEVERVIEEVNPDIIALELDLQRFKKIISKKKNKFRFSDIRKQGFLLNIIGAYIEKYLGKKVGMLPGSEMRKAIEIAKKKKIDLALIDQDINITLRKLKNSFTFKEKLKFISSILTIPFAIFKKQKIRLDLTKVPEQKLINKLTNQVKKQYPTIYRVLIKERDEILAKKTLVLAKENKKIVMIIGAGHVPGVEKILQWNLAKKK